MALNGLLPFASAWGKFEGELSLQTRVEMIYNEYPNLAENQLTRHMRSQFPNLNGITLSACQQQGLIYIFKAYCRYRKCTNCIVVFRY